MIKKISKKAIIRHVEGKRKTKADCLYEEIKSNNKKDEEYKKLQKDLKDLKLQIQKQECKLDALHYEFHTIHSKELPENVVERMPIEDLHDLCGKSNKATLKDAIRASKIQDEVEGLLEEYDEMHAKRRIIEADILQVKINNLLNYGVK